MSHSARTWLLSLSLCASFLASGCKQQAGEICDTDDNCDEGLICACAQAQDGVIVRRGICMETLPMACPAVPRPLEDAGPLPDGGTADGGAGDAGGADDGGPTDAGADAGAIDAGTDAGPGDAGPSDAGTDGGSIDSGPDAAA